MRVSSGSMGIIASPAAAITARAPSFAARAPASGIASSAPPPRHSNSRPKVLSSAPTRVFTKGISGAQQEVMKPVAKKTARVAQAARVICGSGPLVSADPGGEEGEDAGERCAVSFMGSDLAVGPPRRRAEKRRRGAPPRGVRRVKIMVVPQAQPVLPSKCGPRRRKSGLGASPARQ